RARGARLDRLLPLHGARRERSAAARRGLPHRARRRHDGRDRADLATLARRAREAHAGPVRARRRDAGRADPALPRRGARADFRTPPVAVLLRRREDAPMTVADLQDLFAYEAWAHRKLFAVLAQLTDEQFTRTVGGSYGSVRNTLVHAMSAEWGWI